MATEQKLTTMNISLPEGLRAFVEKQVRLGGYTSASEYLRELLRAAQSTVQVEAKLLKSIERGGRIEVDASFWEAKESRIASIIRRHGHKKA
jgi:antitoxin ParD1/3/4